MKKFQTSKYLNHFDDSSKKKDSGFITTIAFSNLRKQLPPVTNYSDHIPSFMIRPSLVGLCRVVDCS